MAKDWYTEEVLRTYAGDGSQLHQLTLGALGLAGESGEVVDLAKKFLYQGHNLSGPELAQELGDVLWYVALLADVMGYSLPELMAMNVQKLHQRYPDGFDPARSLNR